MQDFGKVKLIKFLYNQLRSLILFFHKPKLGCHTSAERARAMLKLLRNKGLEGEPTLAKCRALKKKRKVEKEIQELDTSVIIDDDGKLCLKVPSSIFFS